MFDLKQPCNNCPFRRGVGEFFGMHPDRLIEITSQTAFQCHKTIDYSNFDDPKKRAGDRPQQCAGLMALLRNAGNPNAIMRMGMAFGELDMETLDPRGVAYGSLDEAFKAHTGQPVPSDYHRRASALVLAEHDDH